VPQSDKPPAAAPTTSYARDIWPMFTDLDAQKMAFKFDLRDYQACKARALRIQDRIQGIGGAVMPPPPPRGDGPWPQARIDLFKQWVLDGCPP
jgi:hypothetical protein